MRILIVTPYQELIGGVEVVTSILCEQLRLKGHIVDYLTAEAPDEISYITRFKSIFLGLPAITSARYKKISKSKYDAVICNGEFSYGIEHRKAFAYFHGSYLGLKKYSKNFHLKSYLSLTFRSLIQRWGAKGKKVISVSEFLKEILLEQSIHVDEVISNPIDLTHFAPKKMMDKNKFLFVGRYDYWGKGFDRLEKLALIGHKIHCFTDRSLASTGLVFHPFVSNHDMTHIYNSYKILLFPSRFESFGMAAAEALSCGVPVLMEKVGLAKELADNFPEFVVDNFDEIDDVELKIENILKNYDELSFKARLWAQNNFSIKNYLKKWEEVLNA